MIRLIYAKKTQKWKLCSAKHPTRNLDVDEDVVVEDEFPCMRYGYDGYDVCKRTPPTGKPCSAKKQIKYATTSSNLLVNWWKQGACSDLVGVEESLHMP